jgi:hypothetical protein
MEITASARHVPGQEDNEIQDNDNDDKQGMTNT